MKRSSLVLSFTVLMVFVSAVFNNCAKSGFQVDGRSIASSLGAGGSTIDSMSASDAVNTSMLTADQILRSMSSLTGVPVDDSINAEYARLRSAFGESFALEKVTAPMLLSLTSLAGVFCSRAVAREAALPMAQRKMFKLVNFSGPVAAFNNDAYTDAVNGLTMRFWSRQPKASESSMIKNSRDAFVQAITGPITDVKHTKHLAVYLCTATLSSFDSFSL